MMVETIWPMFLDFDAASCCVGIDKANEIIKSTDIVITDLLNKEVDTK